MYLNFYSGLLFSIFVIGIKKQNHAVLFLHFETYDLWAEPFFFIKKQTTVTKSAKEPTFIVPSENILATVCIPGSITGCRRRCSDALGAQNTQSEKKKSNKKPLNF